MTAAAAKPARGRRVYNTTVWMAVAFKSGITLCIRSGLSFVPGLRFNSAHRMEFSVNNRFDELLTIVVGMR